MNKDALLGLIRHILTTVGGILASRGMIGESDAELVAGALVTIVGVIWSIFDKKKRAGGVETVVSTLLLVALVMPGCAFIGHKEATLEQKFYEVDTMATLSLEAAGNTLRELKDAGIEIPTDVRDGLRYALQSLRVTRAETKAWVSSCSGVPGCDKEERIRLGMKSMVALADLVADLVMEAKTDG